jgi:hypothetical protein
LTTGVVAGDTVEGNHDRFRRGGDDRRTHESGTQAKAPPAAGAARLREFPEEDEAQLMSRFRELEHETWKDHINDETVWQSIMRIAEALAAKEALAVAEVEALMAPEVVQRSKLV